MASWEDMEQEMVDAIKMTEDSDGEPVLFPVVGPTAGERQKRRAIMEKRTGKDMERKWQQEDREALAEAEALAAPPIISVGSCHVCQSDHRLWIERKLVQGYGYKQIADSIPDGSVSRKSISNHWKEHMALDQRALRALMEEEASQLGQNVDEGVRGALTLRGMAEALIRKGFADAQDNVTTVEPRDMIQMIKLLNELNAGSATAAVEEAKVAIQIFKEAIQNVLIKGDIIAREVGMDLLVAIQDEVLRLREDQEVDAMLDRHLQLPPGQ